jgi:TonB-linked SusC/RagA family outer membrane protein
VNEDPDAEPSVSGPNDSLVQVAFRKVAPDNLPAGVSVIDFEELIDKNYNTYSLDNLQGYVGGWNGNSMWGMGDYLVLVDGVPRDANNVLPTEIAEITFLKGASAVVLYGSRAAKGVVQITTRRGKEGPMKIHVRANSGFNVAKSYPKYLGSAEYMTFYNEALANDGLDPLYTEEDIYNFGSGVNPYRYPDLDFYSSEYIKPFYNRSDVTTEISGGNERARYYTNIGYYYQGDVYKFGEAKDNRVSRLNIRGNVDVNLNSNISAFINTNATFYDSRSANASGDNYWASAANLRPNRVAPLIPLSFVDPLDQQSWSLLNNSSNIIDDTYFLGGTQVDLTNVFADYYVGGFSKWTSRQFQFDTGLDFDLKRAVKGLSFHTQFAVDYATSYNSSYNNTYAVYAPSWYNYNGTDIIADITKYNNDEKTGVQNISGSTSRQTISYAGYFKYDRSFNDAHNLNAMLISYAFQQTLSEVYHRTSNANLGLQLGYNFKKRYYLDLGAAQIHSAKLAEGSRRAISPSVTLAWRPSEEGFMENADAIDNLMLSISGSILNTDLDITEYYLYEANFNQSEGAWWGWYDGAVERSANSVRGGNEDLTFVKRKELSANIRASFLQQLITVDASYFVNLMEGLVIEPSTTLFPNYFFTYYPNASFIPFINFNNDRREGFDFALNINRQFGEFGLSAGVVGTYYTTLATQRDENYEYDYQNRAGKPLDGIWGLESDGLFVDQEDIDNSPEQLFGDVNPGDIKYVNQNDDDVIDDQDVVFLATGGWYGAPFTGGLNLTASFKNIRLFVLATGYYGGHGMKNNSYHWVFGDRKYSEVVRDRWTEETAETATYPRLTTQNGSNNFRDSDYWLYKTDRINLAKVQLTYDVPETLLTNFLFKEISAYISGSNLLTISKEREILEMNIGSAPQMRFFNLGVKALF